MKTTRYFVSRDGDLLELAFCSATEAIKTARALWINQQEGQWEVFAFRDYSEDDETPMNLRTYFWLEWSLGMTDEDNEPFLLTQEQPFLLQQARHCIRPTPIDEMK